MNDSDRAACERGRREFLAASIAASLATALPSHHALADESFPSRPLMGLVAAKAGGAFDLLLRMVQPAWEKELGQPLRPTFAPGAAGQIAVTQMLGQPLDGHAFGVDAITNLAVMVHYSQPKHFNLDSLAFIGTLQIEPVALLVRKDAPWTTIGAFLKDARAGRSIKVGVGGNRVFYHLVAAAFKKEAGAADMPLITYQGGGASRNALLGGEIDAVVTGLYAAAPIFDQVNGLVVFDERNPVSDRLPMATSDQLDFELPATLHPTGVYVPAELQRKHPDRFEKLVRTFKAAMENPATHEASRKMGLPEAAFVYWGPERLAAYKGELKKSLDAYGGLL